MDVQYLGNIAFDITQSLRNYDYTKRSVVNLNRVINSRQFEEKDVETIFRFLQDEMEIVSFGDYLKRFLYERTESETPFSQVDDAYYVSVIADCFEMNHAPQAFHEIRSRWSTTIRRWLDSDSVRRDTVFLLGFGLNMTDREVAEFLMKVLKEQGFRFCDPREVIFWHCFHHGLPYSTAVTLLNEYENMPPTGSPPLKDSFWEGVRNSLPVYLSNRTKLREYLAYLKVRSEQPEDDAYGEFRKLYDRAVIAARKYRKYGLGPKGSAARRSSELSAAASRLVQDLSRPTRQSVHDQAGRTLWPPRDPSGRTIWSSQNLSGCTPGFSRELTEHTGAADIEAVMCSGIPRTEKKNLSPVTRSSLSRHFCKKQMSRQRLGRLLSRQYEVDRFDILTLLFLDFAVTVEVNWPNERFIEFIDAANGILDRCGMMGIYPVNPYESFLLMCLLTEDPICAYNEVWEMAYAEQT